MYVPSSAQLSLDETMYCINLLRAFCLRCSWWFVYIDCLTLDEEKKCTQPRRLLHGLPAHVLFNEIACNAERIASDIYQDGNNCYWPLVAHNQPDHSKHTTYYSVGHVTHSIIFRRGTIDGYIYFYGLSGARVQRWDWCVAGGRE